MPSSSCPCTSGLDYGDCCRPLHRNERAPGRAEELMRARFSAFALREVDYLLRTLHSEHPDWAAGEPSLRRSLTDTCRDHRFMRLEVVGSAPADEHGVARVLFVAHVFRRGRDLGFAELSDFRVEDGQLRYHAGTFVDRKMAETEALRLGLSRA